MSATNKKSTGEFRPLSPWEYFGYTFLFSIPIIGWIFLIYFALNEANINRRNFARSFFISLLIWAILMIIFGTTGFLAHMIDFIW